MVKIFAMMEKIITFVVKIITKYLLFFYLVTTNIPTFCQVNNKNLEKNFW